MHCQAQRLLAKYAKNLRKTEVFTIIYSCQSSKSVQRYVTGCIILWKNNVFSRRRLRTPACIDFGRLLARFWRVWASKLEPCWLKLGLIWASNCDFWCLFGDLGALNWFWTSTRADFRALATEDTVLEASRLDFWSPPAVIWRVLAHILLLKFKISSK